VCAVKAINGIIGLNCAGTASISNVSNVGLHELVYIGPFIILTVPFFCSKTHLLSVELLNNMIPYFIIEWKYVKSIILSKVHVFLGGKGKV
jgi:hypothetical protein